MLLHNVDTFFMCNIIFCMFCYACCTVCIGYVYFPTAFVCIVITEICVQYLSFLEVDILCK
jgi:hypothetical protein